MAAFVKLLGMRNAYTKHNFNSALSHDHNKDSLHLHDTINLKNQSRFNYC